MGFDKRENKEVIVFRDHDSKKPNLPELKIELGDFANLTFKKKAVRVTILSIDKDKFTGKIQNDPSPYFDPEEKVTFWEDEIIRIDKQ
jgi:hypothetical protein